MIVFIVGFCFLILIGIFTALGVKKYYENKDKRIQEREEQMRLNEEIKRKNQEKQRAYEERQKEEEEEDSKCKDYEDWEDLNHDTCEFYGEKSYQKRCSNGDINPTFTVSVTKKADQTFLNFDELAPTTGDYQNMPAYAACCECGGGKDGKNFKKWCETNLSPYCPERENTDGTTVLERVIEIVTQEPTFVPQIAETIELVKITDPPITEPPTEEPISFADVSAAAQLDSDLATEKLNALAEELDGWGNAVINGAEAIDETVYTTFDEAYEACKANSECIGWVENKFDKKNYLLKKDNFIDGDIIASDVYMLYIKKNAGSN